ncbi:hypothetical protein [Pseudomonas sp. SBT1-2]|uniref:hypothetical protein n=1 Tax=Pseudomonas sp. SBT1-2 TaxID=3027852 RepID=UPI0023625167|nr:hypothetical protein [Pseudomonas sp. SBT1-2]
MNLTNSVVRGVSERGIHFGFRDDGFHLNFGINKTLVSQDERVAAAADDTQALFLNGFGISNQLFRFPWICCWR